MSGICGMINFDGAPVDSELLRKMAEAAAYRGPDGIHYWVEGNVGLAHLAMNTTPESVREHQPLVSHRGDLVLTADARVDNREELIRTLKTKGYLQEEAPTDADIILAAYECWGEECPKEIVGDFAFILWDQRERKIVCARDALGMRSLRYTVTGNTLIVATESQQILQHPDVSWELDEIAVIEYLELTLDDADHTMFQAIRNVPPASVLTASSLPVKTRRYWDVDFSHQIRYRKDEEYADHFLDIFKRAIVDRLRVREDVVGMLISGGLDSCSIACMIQKIRAEKKDLPELIAYSYMYNQLKSMDERAYSRAVEEECGLRIYYFDVEKYWQLGENGALKPNFETPWLGFGAVNSIVYNDFREKGVRVVLDGNGGDTMMQGTPRVYTQRFFQGDVTVLNEIYQHARAHNVSHLSLMKKYIAKPIIPEGILTRWRRRASQNSPTPITSFRTVINVRMRQKYDSYFNGKENGHKMKLDSIAKEAIYESAVGLGCIRSQMARYASYANGFNIEARHPFFDRRIAEFIISIPPQHHYQMGVKKVLLRRAMREILPEKIRQRNDKSSGMEFHYYGLAKEVDWVNALFRDPLVCQLGFIDQKPFIRKYEEFLTSMSTAWRTGSPWWIITLELWLRNYQHRLSDRSFNQ